MRYLKVFLLLLGLTQLTWAQKQDFHFPKYSVQFEVEDLLKFGSYSGAVLSLKYHFNDSYAIRLGFNTRLDFTKTNDKRYQNSVNQSDSLTINDKTDGDLAQFGINLIGLKYFSITKPIKFYAGSGLAIYREWQNSSNSHWITYSTQNYDREKANWSFVFKLLYGVEWFFHSQMSLNMDYGLNINYYYYNYNEKLNIQWKQPQNEITTKSKNNRTSWSVNPLNIRLGLTVYL